MAFLRGMRPRLNNNHRKLTARREWLLRITQSESAPATDSNPILPRLPARSRIGPLPISEPAPGTAKSINSKAGYDPSDPIRRPTSNSGAPRAGHGSTPRSPRPTDRSQPTRFGRIRTFCLQQSITGALPVELTDYGTILPPEVQAGRAMKKCRADR